MPDINHRVEDVREQLKKHSFLINELEPTIICCSCKKKFSGKHSVRKLATKELRRLLQPYTFLGPEALRLRLDRSALHLYL
jgi:hypothetical protein